MAVFTSLKLLLNFISEPIYTVKKLKLCKSLTGVIIQNVNKSKIKTWGQLFAAGFDLQSKLLESDHFC